MEIGVYNLVVCNIEFCVLSWDLEFAFCGLGILVWVFRLGILSLEFWVWNFVVWDFEFGDLGMEF